MEKQESSCRSSFAKNPQTEKKGNMTEKVCASNQELKYKHLFDGGELNVYATKVLNLGVGAPGTDLLLNCCQMFQTATEHRMKFEQQNAAMLFQYGPTNGTYEARQAIASYLSEAYSSTVKCEDLVVTTGATQGLHVVLSTLLDLNGFVFVDAVTYMIALDAIRQFSSLHIVPVQLNEDGVDLQQLQQFLQKNKFNSDAKEFWAMYYTIPIYHNPTGIVFSETVCNGLIQLARSYDLLIVCDDVYNVLHYKESVSPKRLFAYDQCNDEQYRGNVISNGSFSKIIGPGVRLGWLEVPARIKPLLYRSGINLSGGCFNNYTSGILASIFELGLGQQHIAAMYTAYKERMLAMCATLQANLPNDCHMLEPAGGYFIWITLPKNIDASEFLQMCLQSEKIFFLVGSKFSLKGEYKNSLRLSIAFHNKDKLVDGAHRFCNALKQFLIKSK